MAWEGVRVDDEERFCNAITEMKAVADADRLAEEWQRLNRQVLRFLNTLNFAQVQELASIACYPASRDALVQMMIKYRL